MCHARGERHPLHTRLIVHTVQSSRSRVYWRYIKPMDSNDFTERTSMAAGRKTSTNAGVAPRVFISYARSDGEQFATRLRKRLEAKHIPLWQDRVGMEGGRDWW